MAEIIDIRGRLGRDAAEEAGAAVGGGALFRVRVGGPDLHWVGLVGSVLAGALAGEGFQTLFGDPPSPPSIPPVLELWSGRRVGLGADIAPGLVVVGTGIFPAVLRGCDCRTVLLLRAGGKRLAFAGREVPLPEEAPFPEPLERAAACAGGAARLLGVIGRRALEGALREELTLAVDADRHLSLALDVFDCLAPWAGVVPQLPQVPR